MENTIFSGFLVVFGAMLLYTGLKASDEKIKNLSNFKRYKKVSDELIKFLRIQNIVIGVALFITGVINFYSTLSTTILAIIILSIYIVTVALAFVAKGRYLKK
ncbi:hypothetical protein [Clostridium manihotivorum]|uniref:DUF3784 domain-containing protein n=1 Tax=Clostridium manihotivorum TaxID=2320868 RepID=A0A3R5UDH4_9CLOT|nr:hypothetical protein [Clostridium manihotivorum]QAA30786.1 hypothetical protein C1I91_03445 [Clostridium manihotivorum]